MRKLTFLLALCLAVVGTLTFLLAQVPAYQAYIWIRDTNGRMYHVPVTQGITVAPDHRSVAISGQVFVFEQGLVATTVEGVVHVGFDSSTVLYKNTPPAGPGPCTGGTGVFATDAGHIYTCAPNGVGGFKWIRAPAEDDWQ